MKPTRERAASDLTEAELRALTDQLEANGILGIGAVQHFLGGIGAELQRPLLFHAVVRCGSGQWSWKPPDRLVLCRWFAGLGVDVNDEHRFPFEITRFRYLTEDADREQGETLLEVFAVELRTLPPGSVDGAGSTASRRLRSVEERQRKGSRTVPDGDPG